MCLSLEWEEREEEGKGERWREGRREAVFIVRGWGGNGGKVLTFLHFCIPERLFQCRERRKTIDVNASILSELVSFSSRGSLELYNLDWSALKYLFRDQKIFEFKSICSSLISNVKRLRCFSYTSYKCTFHGAIIFAVCLYSRKSLDTFFVVGEPELYCVFHVNNKLYEGRKKTERKRRFRDLRKEGFCSRRGHRDVGMWRSNVCCCRDTETKE